MIMCEQLYVMNLLRDYMTMSIIHYSVIVLIESGVTFRHIHWIWCHVLTHSLVSGVIF